MSLGLARDSYCGLAKLAQEKENLSDTDEPVAVGSVSQVLLKDEPGFASNGHAIGPCCEPVHDGEDSAASLASSSVMFGEETLEPLGEETFEPLSTPSKNNCTRKLWCCWFRPWHDPDGEEDFPEDHVPPLASEPYGAGSVYRPMNNPYCGRDISQMKRGSNHSIMKKGSVRKAFEQTSATSSRRILPVTYHENPRFVFKHVRFDPMARSIGIKSLHAMTAEEKSNIWWQAEDFELFKRGNMIITRAILEGGSQTWLANTTEAHPRRECEQNDPKWWHQFGHSRRGLEQVVSCEEARQRQQTVRMALHAVLDEQKRQRILGRKSPAKIAQVAREWTAWAKDLALAAGSSDADAVQSDFVETRKSREYFLLSFTLQSECVVAPHTPSFMVPAGLPTKILDAHTSSTMLFRKRMQMQLEQQRKLNAKEKMEGVGESDHRPANPAKKSLSSIAAGYGGGRTKVNASVAMSTYNQD